MPSKAARLRIRKRFEISEKFRLKIIVELFVFTWIFACTNGVRAPGDLEEAGRNKFQLDQKIHIPLSSPLDASGKDYMAIGVPFQPVATLHKNVQSSFHVTLKNRGEAHITVVTPPEFAVLTKKISRNEMLDLARELKLNEANFSTICLGKAQKNAANASLETYFIVVEARDGLTFRQKVQELYLKRGGTADTFQAKLFYPHITVGFTARDLHFEDGVIKDAKSCVGDIVEG